MNCLHVDNSGSGITALTVRVVCGRQQHQHANEGVQNSLKVLCVFETFLVVVILTFVGTATGRWKINTKKARGSAYCV